MSLYTKAINDLDSAKILLKESKTKGNDILYIDNICYHLQQCLEKNLKFLIELKGEKYGYTHDIFSLVETAYNLYQNDPRLIALLEDIWKRSNMYTAWESKSRYDDNFKELLSNVNEAIEYCEELLAICKIKENELN